MSLVRGRKRPISVHIQYEERYFIRTPRGICQLERQREHQYVVTLSDALMKLHAKISAIPPTDPFSDSVRLTADARYKLRKTERSKQSRTRGSTDDA